tara:strand:- start:230 stop:550 length:321 start_codon:yes stop_codon:yes gene_type:complete
MSKEEEEKLEQLSEKLADKEDEQDMLFEKIYESFKETVDFIGDYAREGLEYLEDADKASHFEEGVITLDTVADEIRHLMGVLAKNSDDISRLTALEEEIEKLEEKI